MRELAEFRLLERFAPRLFKDNEGKRLGDGVRKIEIDVTDPRFAEIGRLDRQLKTKRDSIFFSSWTIRRKYTRQELQEARLFLFRPTAYFEPEGEECGTIYDESSTCASCGAGARQVGPLFLRVRRIPKGKDFAITIAGEIVVSQRAAGLFKRHRVTGVDFGPVRAGAKSKEDSKNWFQLIVRTPDAEIVPPTRIGLNPFDDNAKGECRCPAGDLLGLNLLSEVTIRAATRGKSDFISSRQFIGVREGVLRPERVILISPKVWKLIASEKLKGCKVEVAHLA